MGSEPKPLIEKQTRRKIMSFFERLKTEASAEWRRALYGFASSMSQETMSVWGDQSEHPPDADELDH